MNVAIPGYSASCFAEPSLTTDVKVRGQIRRSAAADHLGMRRFLDLYCLWVADPLARHPARVQTKIAKWRADSLQFTLPAKRAGIPTDAFPRVAHGSVVQLDCTEVAARRDRLNPVAAIMVHAPLLSFGKRAC